MSEEVISFYICVKLSKAIGLTLAVVKNIQELIRHVAAAVAPLYEAQEAHAIALQVAEQVLQRSRLQLSTDRQQPVSEAQWQQAAAIIERLQQHEPLQYVLGQAHFYGLELEVSPAVLIPRPETEELVDLIVREHARARHLHIVDVCTGSGCIPIALSAHLSIEKIYGVDISEPALAIARKNALKYGRPISWLRQDILKEDLALPAAGLDIMVSNPPYVLEQEKTFMRKNVLTFEPHLALFVPDNNALLFYKRISELGLRHLKPDGKLYFEINEQQAAPLRQLMEAMGYGLVEVLQDLFGKDRFVRAKLQAN
jgi:release factor glutamine methyltransferase